MIMIEEEGTVVEVRDDIAVIKAKRTTACEKCVSKKICQSVSETEMMVEAINPVGAHQGDEVVFTVGAATMLKAGVLIYLFPLLAFIAGVVVGQAVVPGITPELNKDLASTVLGFIFLTATYLLLSIYSKSAEKNRTYMARILRVV